MTRARLLAVAVGFAIGLVASAPFVAEFRAAIARAFPLQTRAILGAVVALSIAAALMIAAARINDRRVLRYLALGTALLVGALFARVLSTGDRDTDVVEMFHFVE